MDYRKWSPSCRKFVQGTGAAGLALLDRCALPTSQILQWTDAELLARWFEPDVYAAVVAESAGKG